MIYLIRLVDLICVRYSKTVIFVQYYSADIDLLLVIFSRKGF